MHYHQGRLIDHVHLNVTDMSRSYDFYAALFAALGISRRLRQGRDWLALDEFYLEQCEPGQPPSRIHLCFQARTRDAVDRFHAAGLRAGGRDNGAPGLRDYHPGYYAAYLLDPDGNNIEAKLDERILFRDPDSVWLGDAAERQRSMRSDRPPSTSS